MDILLLFVGIIFLCKGREDWVLFIIVFLASNYFQMRLPTEIVRPTIPFVHHVSDTGLLLYVLLFCRTTSVYGVQTSDRKVNIGLGIFAVYLIFSVIVDLTHNVLLSDIFFLLRPFLYFTLIFITGSFSYNTCLAVIKKIYYSTIALCALILFQRFSSIEIIPFIEITGRGVKPPIFAIFCSFLAFINYFDHNKTLQVIYVFLLLFPILIIAKMTYLISVFLLIALYISANNGVKFSKIVISVILLSVLSIVSVFFFPDLVIRMEDFLAGMENVKDVEYSDNSSYRLAHAYERLLYVIHGGGYEFFRGVGFISEAHFHSNVFDIGLINRNTDEVIQLDTGDIAWSLFFVRYGIVGTVIFLFFIGSLINSLLNVSQLSRMFAFYLIVAICFQSFGNAVVFDAFFYILPLLFVNKTSEIETIQEYE